MSREVKLIPHSGKNLVTGEVQHFHQWMIYLCEDGVERHVGILGWAEGSRILFVRPVDPPTTSWIEQEIEKQNKERRESVSCPDIPLDLVNNSVGELDEFDEKDLIG
jgi:hypothetical protein